MDELAAGQVPPVRRGSVRGEEHHLRAHHRGAPHAQGKPVFIVFLVFKAFHDFVIYFSAGRIRLDIRDSVPFLKAYLRIQYFLNSIGAF